MCREAAWAELTVEVTSMVGVRSKARGLNKYKSHDFPDEMFGLWQDQMRMTGDCPLGAVSFFVVSKLFGLYFPGKSVILDVTDKQAG